MQLDNRSSDVILKRWRGRHPKNEIIRLKNDPLKQPLQNGETQSRLAWKSRIHIKGPTP